MRCKIRHRLHIKNKDGLWISMLVMMTILVLFSLSQEMSDILLAFSPGHRSEQLFQGTFHGPL